MSICRHVYLQTDDRAYLPMGDSVDWSMNYVSRHQSPTKRPPKLRNRPDRCKSQGESNIRVQMLLSPCYGAWYLTRDMEYCIANSWLSQVRYRVAQINPYKFQKVGNTYTKRNSNICFIQVIVYIHSS